VNEADICTILSAVLYQFPLQEVLVDLPDWFKGLKDDHWLKNELFEMLTETAQTVKTVNEVERLTKVLSECQRVQHAGLGTVELGCGRATVTVGFQQDLFYQILSEETGLSICGQQGLMGCLIELADMKKRYDKVKSALDEVERVGYGIVMPQKEEMTLEEPEIMKQGSQYGVRLKARAPSIHMMRADIRTEITPVVGSEKQSEDLVRYLLSGFEDDPTQIWDSNIFGKSLHDLVNEGLHTKLARMPQDARNKIQETISRVINEGCSGLICIIL
jgi:stage IV sporulation protein A